MSDLRVTNLRGRTAGSAPILPDGAVVTGVVTATSFSGDGSALTGIDATSLKDSGGTVRVQANTDGAVVTGILTSTTFEDSIGKLRSIPQNSKSSAYTLIASDAGKHIGITTGGVTIPTATLSVGDAVGIYNNSEYNQIITEAVGVTLRLSGTASTGNRTLAQYGMCTVLCVGANTFVVSGSGLS